jgi:hypothetical protein
MATQLGFEAPPVMVVLATQAIKNVRKRAKIAEKNKQKPCSRN